MKRSMSAQLSKSTTSRQSTQSGSTLTKHLGESRCQFVHAFLPESSKSGDRQDLCAGTPSAGSSESRRIHRYKSQSRVLSDACRCFPCIFPCQGSEARAGENIGRRLLKKCMYSARDAASNWERDWQGHLENEGYELGAQFKMSVSQ